VEVLESAFTGGLKCSRFQLTLLSRKSLVQVSQPAPWAAKWRKTRPVPPPKSNTRPPVQPCAAAARVVVR
jgi:hypothetical protein